MILLISAGAWVPAPRGGVSVVDLGMRLPCGRSVPHSPADYVRRLTVPAESATLGLGHPQFAAPTTTARLSADINDVALIAFELRTE